MFLNPQTTDDGYRKAAKVDWQSDALDLYAKRLTEAKDRRSK